MCRSWLLGHRLYSGSSGSIELNSIIYFATYFLCRSPSTHVMSPWIRHLFLSILPRLLMMRPPHQKSVNVPRLCVQTNHGAVLQQVSVQNASSTDIVRNCTDGQLPQQPTQWAESASVDMSNASRYRKSPPGLGLIESMQPVVRHAMFGINFISEHVKQQDEFQRVSRICL